MEREREEGGAAVSHTLSSLLGKAGRPETVVHHQPSEKLGQFHFACFKHTVRNFQKKESCALR